LLATSRPDERAQWSSLGPFLTVGKRAVQPADLRQRMGQVLELVQRHLGALYDAYVEALESQQRSDGLGTAEALRRAGGAESDAGRAGQVSYRLGELLRRRGDYTGAAEHLTRARERFEAVGDPGGLAKVLDTQGQVDAQLGRRASALGSFREALAWCRRAPSE